MASTSTQLDASYMTDHFEQTTVIFEACKRLKLSSISCFTACAIYHKFYQKIKETLFGKFKDIDIVGPSSIYLASKVKEEPVKIRDVVNVCYRILHPSDLPLEIGDRYWSLRDSVLNCELYILRIFNFNMSIATPHQFLQTYLNSIKSWTEPLEWNNANVPQFAWNMLQDSFHLPMCTKLKPEILALALVKTAVECTHLAVSTEGSEMQWWQAFCPNVKETELENISSRILLVYQFESSRKTEKLTA